MARWAPTQRTLPMAEPTGLLDLDTANFSHARAPRERQRMRRNRGTCSILRLAATAAVAAASGAGSGVSAAFVPTRAGGKAERQAVDRSALLAGFQPYRQSSVALADAWDPATLASFSVSQLDALSQLSAGLCPQLSRALRCKRLRAGQRWRDAAETYLAEEASLTLRQAREMLRHVWRNYEEKAFGNDELRPVSGEGTDSWGGLGQTLVDSLDTLWLGGFHEEFHTAADWVEANLSFSVDLNVNFFETSIRNLGGLLAAYWLSGRVGLLEKAKDLGERLLLAYRTAEFKRAPAAENKAGDLGSSISDFMAKLGLSSDRIGKFIASFQESGQLDPSNQAQVPASISEQAGIPQDAQMQAKVKALAQQAYAQAQAAPVQEEDLLPFSDINLDTGVGDNLGGFVSLAEAYVPIEWKALSLFTGNCSFARAQDEVLAVINRSTRVDMNGLAPIMLSPDGKTYPSSENRFSLGGRGDSFYEYLLKDTIFSGHDVPASLWESFLKHLPNLFVQVDPKTSVAELASWPIEASELSAMDAQTVHDDAKGGKSAKPSISDGRWRRKWRRSSAQQEVATEVNEDVPKPAKRLEHVDPADRNRVREWIADMSQWRISPRRGGAGAKGGWYEDASDAKTPWLFLKEVSGQQTIPKMDHLICFLPGALALDVLHNGNLKPGEQPSKLSQERLQELGAAHLLARTCVHMYFRTASDLAPEITRFSSHGLVDDLGSMHNILRPETIESLTILWRTTKDQVFRNWGQRLLAAFARTRTPHGFASMNNVNRPKDVRDDMPSFFVAETLKYGMLLFSDDSVVPLTDVVLNTEAHPLPTVERAVDSGLAPAWNCGGYAGGDGGRRRRRSRLQPKNSGRASELDPVASIPRGKLGLEVIRRSVVDLGNARDLDNDGYHAVTDATTKLADAPPTSSATAKVAQDAASSAGDPSCWVAGFTFDLCCLPPPAGNLGCWDAEFTYARCCAR